MWQLQPPSQNDDENDDVADAKTFETKFYFLLHLEIEHALRD